MASNNLLRVGLTGGIGSGKSTVASLFEDLGVSIIDADLVARDVVAPNSKGLNAVIQKFGQHLLCPDGQLDRTALKTLIFSNDDDRLWLEHTLHPLIRDNMRDAISNATPPYCILVIPLLTESNAIDFVDRVLVVDAPEALQIKRVLDRDNTQENLVKAIMASQNTREARLAQADDIIMNDSDLSHLRTSVKTLDAQYRKHANEN